MFTSMLCAPGRDVPGWKGGRSRSISPNWNSESVFASEPLAGTLAFLVQPYPPSLSRNVESHLNIVF